MNLDALFQQIEFTEKQAREKRHLIQQAKVDINRSYEKINQIKEELSTAKMKLETKVQHLCEKQFYLEILKKREDSLGKQKAELTNQKSSLLKILADAKRKMTEEEDNFTGEVTEFNNEYGLTSNRNLLIKKKVKTEINDLENEAALLKNEMESMEHKNVQLNALQLQKNELKQDLFTLQSELKDLEKVIREAEKMTKDLEAEKVQVTEKPQTDPECLSLSPLHAYSNEPKTEYLQGSQSNLEEDRKTAPWVEGQFLSFRKNSGGTQSTAELPNAIRASADWLYNLPQSLTEMEWIGHNSLLGSEQETTPFFKCGHNQGKDKKEKKKKMFYLSQQTITKRQPAPSAAPTIAKLKKELENCKDDDWESICETLRTEIEILQMNLSQKKSSDK